MTSVELQLAQAAVRKAVDELEAAEKASASPNGLERLRGVLREAAQVLSAHWAELQRQPPALELPAEIAAQLKDKIEQARRPFDTDPQRGASFFETPAVRAERARVSEAVSPHLFKRAGLMADLAVATPIVQAVTKKKVKSSADGRIASVKRWTELDRKRFTEWVELAKQAGDVSTGEAAHFVIAKWRIPAPPRDLTNPDYKRVHDTIYRYLKKRDESGKTKAVQTSGSS